MSKDFFDPNVFDEDPEKDPTTTPVSGTPEPPEPPPFEVTPTHEAAAEPAGDFDTESEANPAYQLDTFRTAIIWLFCAVVGILLGMVTYFIFTSWTMGWLPGWVPLLVAVVIVLSSLFYARSVVKMNRERQPTDQQMAVPAYMQYIWVKQRTLYRIRHVLSVDRDMPEASEQRIHIVFRRHKMYAVKQCFLPAVALTAYIVLSIWSAVVTNIEDELPWFVWFGAFFALCLWLYIRYLRWQDWFFVMTDKNIILLELHSEWFWWLNGTDPRLPVRDVRFIATKDMAPWGNAFGYGALSIDGLTSLDVAYNDVDYVPNHHTIGKFAMMQVSAN